MHEAGAMLDDPLLQMAHDPAQLGSLPMQSVHDVRLGHRNSPSWIKVQDGNRATPSLGTWAWWQLLHDTASNAESWPAGRTASLWERGDHNRRGPAEMAWSRGHDIERGLIVGGAS